MMKLFCDYCHKEYRPYVETDEYDRKISFTFGGWEVQNRKEGEAETYPTTFVEISFQDQDVCPGCLLSAIKDKLPQENL